MIHGLQPVNHYLIIEIEPFPYPVFHLGLKSRAPSAVVKINHLNFTLDSRCPIAGRKVPRMKLNVLNWNASETAKHIGTFGQAELYRSPDGKFELAGGTRDDRFEALEWASLFLHDAVFDPTCPTKYPERN
mgnify:CR=1 FL=1